MAKRVRPLVAKVIIIDDNLRNAALLKVWLEALSEREAIAFFEPIDFDAAHAKLR